jgi:hypothetical protein
MSKFIKSQQEACCVALERVSDGKSSWPTATGIRAPVTPLSPLNSPNNLTEPRHHAWQDKLVHVLHHKYTHFLVLSLLVLDLLLGVCVLLELQATMPE